MKVFDLHKAIWSSLLKRRDRLPHALLLSGQRGLGKFELAQAFAGFLLCEAPLATGQACGQCLACNWFSQGNHPDFRLLQPEADSEGVDGEEGKKKASQQITIDQVRALDEFLGVGSHRGGLSIVLINPAEAMNRNAANSILKTLEEPPPGILFLLVTSEPSRLLPTIRSRCQVVPVPIPEASDALAYLVAAGVANSAHWLALAGGAPRIAVELAASGQGGWLNLLSNWLAAGQHIDALTAAAEIDKALRDSKGRLQLKHVVEVIQKWLVDLTLLGNQLAPRYFLEQTAKTTALAAMIPSVRLLHFYRNMNQRRLEAEQPLNAKLFLEGIFLDYRALFGR